MKPIFLNKENRDAERTIWATALAVVMVGALVTVYLAGGAKWEEGYSVGYNQSCADVRATVAARLEQEKFFITNLGMSFHRVGDRTFYIHFTDTLPVAPKPGAVMAQAKHSGK